MTVEMVWLLVGATVGPGLGGIVAGYLMERSNQRYWARFWAGRS